MNRIVREHYSVEKLPEDLRPDFSGAGDVRITVEPLSARDQGDLPLTRLLEEMQEHRVFADDPVKRVRALRAEWKLREELHDRIRSDDND